MTATRLARSLGLDRNPLRRRTDRIAVCLAAVLIAVFLAGAPVLSTVAVGWANRATTAGQQTARSGRQVPVAVQQATPLHPPGRRAVLAREAAAAAVATVALGVVLLSLAWAGRQVINRRRLSAWETSWAIVGPQWTKRFRSRG